MKKNLLLLLSGLLISFGLTAQTDTILNGTNYTLFAPGLWVEIEATPFTCGDSVTFMYNGQEVTYGTVPVNYESNDPPHNIGSRCWLDRNLGADRVAEDSDDEQGYGDLFQWGRGDDGHQMRGIGECDNDICFDVMQDNANLPINATTAGAWDGKFIYNMPTPFDWHQNNPDNDLWQGVGRTNNPCPEGWRIPTDDEWEAERNSWLTNNAAGAINSPLKLPKTGTRSRFTGGFFSINTSGLYWSANASETNANNANILSFSDLNSFINSNNRAAGNAVRCIRD